MEKKEESLAIMVLGIIIVIFSALTYPSEFEQFFGADPTWNIIGLIIGAVFIVWGLAKYTESKKQTQKPEN